jgi:hypothetical protein
LDRGIHDPTLPRFGQPRRGHVNGLLEERSFQGIGFVEEGEEVESTPVESPSSATSARNISFDEKLAVSPKVTTSGC